MRIKQSIIIVFLFIMGVNNLHAQYLLGDFSLSRGMESWYDEQVGLENTLLLNGKKFDFTRKSSNSHAFYKDQSWVKMDITYFGHTFEAIDALYNLEDDLLIIKNPNDDVTPIQLTTGQVTSFDMGDAYFEMIEHQVGYRTSGFYQILFRGEQVELISRISKSLQIVSGRLSYVTNYYPYIKSGDGDYKLITRFGNLKRMFPSHKQKLRKFKKNIGLKGRLDNGEKFDGFVRLMEYCDNLMIQ